MSEKLQLAARTLKGAKTKRIDVEQLELLDKMLKSAERRHAFRVRRGSRTMYLAYLYNVALLGAFRDQDELDAFMKERLSRPTGAEQAKAAT